MNKTLGIDKNNRLRYIKNTGKTEIENRYLILLFVCWQFPKQKKRAISHSKEGYAAVAAEQVSRWLVYVKHNRFFAEEDGQGTIFITYAPSGQRLLEGLVGQKVSYSYAR